MFAALCSARGDCVAVIDTDMQDPPELIPKMLENLRTGDYDSVATRRESRTGEPGNSNRFSKDLFGWAGFKTLWISYDNAERVAGWASTASIIVFIGGVQLFCLGIMGKYLAKIYI